MVVRIPEKSPYFPKNTNKKRRFRLSRVIHARQFWNNGLFYREFFNDHVLETDRSLSFSLESLPFLSPFCVSRVESGVTREEMRDSLWNKYCPRFMKQLGISGDLKTHVLRTCFRRSIDRSRVVTVSVMLTRRYFPRVLLTLWRRVISLPSLR